MNFLPISIKMKIKWSVFHFIWCRLFVYVFCKWVEGHKTHAATIVIHIFFQRAQIYSFKELLMNLYLFHGLITFSNARLNIFNPNIWWTKATAVILAESVSVIYVRIYIFFIPLKQFYVTKTIVLYLAKEILTWNKLRIMTNNGHSIEYKTLHT